MSRNDTVDLLRECNSGIKMGVASIDDVLPKVQNERFEKILTECKDRHQALGDETHRLLCEYGEKTQDPNPMAKAMSKIKTGAVLSMGGGDKSIADIMTDGCDMGVKSLNKYLNLYSEADERAKDITKRLISLEERLSTDMRCYL